MYRHGGVDIGCLETADVDGLKYVCIYETIAKRTQQVAQGPFILYIILDSTLDRPLEDL